LIQYNFSYGVAEKTGDPYIKPSLTLSGVTADAKNEILEIWKSARRFFPASLP